MAEITVSDISRVETQVVAGEFISEGQMVYIGNDGLAYNADPNAPKSVREAQDRRMELRQRDLERFVNWLRDED
jgi:hypothetical protein